MLGEEPHRFRRQTRERIGYMPQQFILYPDLTAREISVLKLVADGRTNRLIGEDLGLSALTVKSHLARISRKLGTGDRAELVAISIRGGVHQSSHLSHVARTYHERA